MTQATRAMTTGRAPAQPVICRWADKPPECYLCTWVPAPRKPGHAMLKLVHAGCLEHLRLDTVTA